MTYSVPPHVADEIERTAREGTVSLIHVMMRRSVRDGVQVGALNAFGPDIAQASECPAGYMPRWLANLIPMLDRFMDVARYSEYFLRLASCARDWSVLSDAAWARVHVHFLDRCIESTLVEGAAVQPLPLPDYWHRVLGMCRAVIPALEGHGDLAQAREEVQTWARAGDGPLSVAAASSGHDAYWGALLACNVAWEAAKLDDQSTASAADFAASAIPSRRADAEWFLLQQLFALLDTEIAAAKGLGAPVSR